MVRLPEDIVALIAARVLDDDDLKTGQAALACLCRVSKLVNVIATNELYKTLYVDLKHDEQFERSCVMLPKQQFKCLQAVSCLRCDQKVRVVRLTAEFSDPKDKQDLIATVSVPFAWLESHFGALRPNFFYFLPIFTPRLDESITLETGKRFDSPELSVQQMLLEVLFIPRLVSACTGKLTILETTVLPCDLVQKLGQTDRLDKLTVSSLPWSFMLNMIQEKPFVEQGQEMLDQTTMVEDVNNPLFGMMKGIFDRGALKSDQASFTVSNHLTELTILLDFTSGLCCLRSWFSELAVFLTKRVPTIDVVRFDGTERMPALAYMWSMRYDPKDIVDFMAGVSDKRASPLTFLWNAEFWTPVEFDELNELIEQAKNKGHDLNVVFEGKPLAKPGGHMRRGEAQHRTCNKPIT